MFDSYIPKIDEAKLILNPKIDTDGPAPFRLSAVKPEKEIQSFSGVMNNLIKGFDQEAKKPDKMIAEAMVNPDIDIHDVMIAVNQSELILTIATQGTTKFIQGYEKIISMQV